MPSPDQIQAAMPAMREWLRHRLDGAKDRLATHQRWFERRFAGAASDFDVSAYIGRHYPGGVEQFIADQEGRGG